MVRLAETEGPLGTSRGCQHRSAYTHRGTIWWESRAWQTSVQSAVTVSGSVTTTAPNAARMLHPHQPCSPAAWRLCRRRRRRRVEPAVARARSPAESSGASLRSCSSWPNPRPPPAAPATGSARSENPRPGLLQIRYKRAGRRGVSPTRAEGLEPPTLQATIPRTAARRQRARHLARAPAPPAFARLGRTLLPANCGRGVAKCGSRVFQFLGG